MERQILFSAEDLLSAQKASRCITVDCRFYLHDTGAGFKKYLSSHIPGAIYAHLDNDLSGTVTSSTGRHPLPDPHSFASFLARAGWAPGKLLVAYDDAGGSIAARLWWLMKYFGHDCGVLLEGGIDTWCEAGFELENGAVENAKSPTPELSVNEDLARSTADIVEALANREIVLADARASERFAGKVESIDTVAGHVPGSFNYPFTLNLKDNQAFRTVAELRAGFRQLLGGHEAKDLVHMCGSGVTACLNLFAAELAGLKDTKLYVGSWSEWIQDSSRPVEP